MRGNLEESIIGCLLGTAVGDATGLCCEGLSQSRQHKLYPNLTGPQLFLGRGMMSDDTEHTCLVAQALIASAGDVAIFEWELARQLRIWILGLPAGTGKATLQACLKLWLGYGPQRSGVFSAGNGPAMRSAIIGVCYGHNLALMTALVRASTRLTHTDPKAEYGAVAVALAASLGNATPAAYYQELQQLLGTEADEFLHLIGQAVEAATENKSVPEFAAQLGLDKGVSGYVYHTVPVAIYAWFRHGGDCRTAVLETMHSGGDTDSTAAIVGGIIGATGKAGIPQEWLASLWEWPRSVAWMENLGQRLTQVGEQGTPQPPLPLSQPGLWLRNSFFLFVVLLHGFRRLLPPY